MERRQGVQSELSDIIGGVVQQKFKKVLALDEDVLQMFYIYKQQKFKKVLAHLTGYCKESYRSTNSRNSKRSQPNSLQSYNSLSTNSRNSKRSQPNSLQSYNSLSTNSRNSKRSQPLLYLCTVFEISTNSRNSKRSQPQKMQMVL